MEIDGVIGVQEGVSKEKMIGDIPYHFLNQKTRTTEEKYLFAHILYST